MSDVAPRSDSRSDARSDWQPIDQTPAWRRVGGHEEGRGRWGWIFSTVWLFYLIDPISAIYRHPAGPVRLLGFAAVACFALAYLAIFYWARRYRAAGVRTMPLRRRLAVLGLMIGLGLLTIPAAGPHGTATGVYISASAMMLLPVQYAWSLVGAMVAAISISTYSVPSWHAEGSGNALGVLLAGLAVFGMRLAFDRNIQLMIARDQVAELAVSAERERMARDMHDILGHSLTVITVKAELAGRLIEVDPHRAGAEIADLERLSREALADIRATIGGFREVTLARELANAKSALTAAGITPDLPGAVDEVPGERRELFGWAVREGVTNVVRHSGASRCTVRVTRDLVEVIDDGRGVEECPGDSPGAADVDPTPGHGLSGLRERARAAGVSMSIGQGDGGRGFRLILDAGAGR